MRLSKVAFALAGLGPTSRVVCVFVERILTALPWAVLVLLCLTVGLLPFRPPHLFSKLRMLREGRLLRPADWLDLVIHAIPWLLLAAKATLALCRVSSAA
jgi:hypothetical protein